MHSRQNCTVLVKYIGPFSMTDHVQTDRTTDEPTFCVQKQYPPVGCNRGRVMSNL